MDPNYEKNIEAKNSNTNNSNNRKSKNKKNFKTKNANRGQKDHFQAFFPNKETPEKQNQQISNESKIKSKNTLVDYNSIFNAIIHNINSANLVENDYEEPIKVNKLENKLPKREFKIQQKQCDQSNQDENNRKYLENLDEYYKQTKPNTQLSFNNNYVNINNENTSNENGIQQENNENTKLKAEIKILKEEILMLKSNKIKSDQVIKNLHEKLNSQNISNAKRLEELNNELKSLRSFVKIIKEEKAKIISEKDNLLQLFNKLKNNLRSKLENSLNQYQNFLDGIIYIFLFNCFLIINKIK